MGQFRDEWLASGLEALVGKEKLDELLNAEEVQPTVWETVVAGGVAKDEEILATVATRFRLKLADLAVPDAKTRDLVPEQFARKYCILPVRATDSYLEIATANPFDLDCEKTLAFATGREVRSLLASPSAILSYLDDTYKAGAALERLLDGMADEVEVEQIKENEEELKITEAEASQRPVVRMVDLILSEGVLSKASDIHIESEESGVAVRYRIDGVLRKVMDIPRAAGLPLVSRIKIMASLDIADRLRPQDGRARIAIDGHPIDLRISTLPASQGEKVVIRILDSTRSVISLERLGLAPHETAAIEELLTNRDGILLVTGPTGSGKTTTLYSALRFVQSEGVNIVTVEDPVEYRLPGVVQVQVNEKARLTFAAALRSILRQDPDVVLLGEIRDAETGQIAVQASLTGHLVLSTLHTNDAANAVTRLVDLGIEAFKVGSALRGVVAQRLMRSLCTACKAPRTDPLPGKFSPWIPEGTQLYQAIGCQQCAMTGYSGRFSIVEVLKVTPAVERITAEGGTADKISDAAVADGMKSLWESGIWHIIRGDSTVEELLRVVDMPQDDAERPSASRSGASSSGRTGAKTDSDRKRTSGPVGTVDDETEKSRGGFELLDTISSEVPIIDVHGIRVLLVDDEDQLRNVMKDLLEREGFHIVEAATGAEALDQVDKHAPDLIVLDLNLPELDGYGVLTRLRGKESTKNIPVIVLTARGDEDNEVRVFELGADDFLSKPFRARALSRRIHAVLNRAAR
ncbi:MAG: type II/IV secretion system protein [Gemmatimonadota bacterium]|nr:type II/IV secretion system protein [Gemmatimonadota bacterium]